MINGNTRQNKQEYKDQRKEAHKIFGQKKKKYCTNQSCSKWKLLTLTMK
jgi:hypothetical protein